LRRRRALANKRGIDETRRHVPSRYANPAKGRAKVVTVMLCADAIATFQETKEKESRLGRSLAKGYALIGHIAMDHMQAAMSSMDANHEGACPMISPFGRA